MHEDELQREIQTAVPILAPEVLSAFAHSQIFHDSSQKQKSKTMSSKSNFLTISYSKLSKSSCSISSSILSPRTVSSRHNHSCASIIVTPPTPHPHTTPPICPSHLASAHSTPSLHTTTNKSEPGGRSTTKYTFPPATPNRSSPPPARSSSPFLSLPLSASSSSSSTSAMTRSNTKGRIFETEAAEKLLSRLEGND